MLDKVYLKNICLKMFSLNFKNVMWKDDLDTMLKRLHRCEIASYSSHNLYRKTEMSEMTNTYSIKKYLRKKYIKSWKCQNLSGMMN